MNQDALDKITELLDKYKEDLNNNNFTPIYKELNYIDDYDDNNEDYYITPLFTEVLMKAGIDPLPYMRKVPPYYIANLDIKSINIPDNITEIGELAFYNNENLTNVRLSNNLRVIKDSAFDSCKELNSITLPASIQIIEPRAFADCYKLKNINYNGTTDQWVNVKIDKYNSEIIKQIIHCKDGDIGAVEVTFGGEVRWKKIGI